MKVVMVGCCSTKDNNRIMNALGESYFRVIEIAVLVDYLVEVGGVTVFVRHVEQFQSF